MTSRGALWLARAALPFVQLGEDAPVNSNQIRPVFLHAELTPTLGS